jgi:acyl-CoA synthetase (AMP-forming)/AMP-acid ligase II
MAGDLNHRLEEHATRYPQKAAFVFKRGAKWDTFTFGQLFERSEQLAPGLSTLGLRAGQRAALMSPPSPDFFALAFALLKTGIVPVMVDPAIGLSNVTEAGNLYRQRAHTHHAQNPWLGERLDQSQHNYSRSLT